MTNPRIAHDDWFDDPPRPEEEVADNFNWEDTAPSEYEPPDDTYASRHKSTPDHEKGAEEVVTMHEKMYRIATARYNPFSIGGSENCDSDLDCNIGGSEQCQQ